MERKVPWGISFLFAGTMTVRVFPILIFLYLIWLPFCDTNRKPFFSRTEITWLEEYSLGIVLEGDYFRVFDRRGCLVGCILKVQF